MKSLKSPFWNKYGDLEEFNFYMNNKLVISSITLSLELFVNQFLIDGKFTTDGILLLIKIYQPFGYLTNNTKI